jgi:hypothetical protein
MPFIPLLDFTCGASACTGKTDRAKNAFKELQRQINRRMPGVAEDGIIGAQTLSATKRLLNNQTLAVGALAALADLYSGQIAKLPVTTLPVVPSMPSLPELVEPGLPELQAPSTGWGWWLFAGLGAAVGVGTLIYVSTRRIKVLSGPPQAAITATFARVEGEWGARVSGQAPPIGAELQITRKDGTVAQARVERVAAQLRDHALVLIRVVKEAKAKSRPLQRMHELVEHVRQDPGQSFRHYAYWAAGMTDQPLRSGERARFEARSPLAQRGGMIVAQAVDRGLVHVLTHEKKDSNIVVPFGAPLPSGYRIAVSSRGVAQLLMDRRKDFDINMVSRSGQSYFPQAVRKE